MRKLIILFMLMVGMFSTNTVWANVTIEAIGDPVEGNSWGQQFGVGGGNFDLIALKITSADDTFEDPAFQNFVDSDGSWNSFYVSDTEAYASGNTDDYLLFDIMFNEDEENPVEFDIKIYNNQILDSVWHASYPGSGGKFAWVITAIPAPGAILLGSIGIGLVGYMRRRKIL